jgi:hypothetical protein
MEEGAAFSPGMLCVTSPNCRPEGPDAEGVAQPASRKTESNRTAVGRCQEARQGLPEGAGMAGRYRMPLIDGDEPIEPWQ